MKKTIKFITFLFYTYCLANSVLVAMCIVYFYKYTLMRGLEIFSIIFCQWFIILNLIYAEDIWDVIGIIIILLYETVVIFCPAYLFWRERTIFYAWLIAMTGLFWPGYVYIYLYKNPDYIIFPALVMTGGYVLAWVIMRSIQQHEKSETSRETGASKRNWM